jgi:hypothetical protein
MRAAVLHGGKVAVEKLEVLFSEMRTRHATAGEGLTCLPRRSAAGSLSPLRRPIATTVR